MEIDFSEEHLRNAMPLAEYIIVHEKIESNKGKETKRSYEDIKNKDIHRNYNEDNIEEDIIFGICLDMDISAPEFICEYHGLQVHAGQSTFSYYPTHIREIDGRNVYIEADFSGVQEYVRSEYEKSKRGLSAREISEHFGTTVSIRNSDGKNTRFYHRILEAIDIAEKIKLLERMPGKKRNTWIPSSTYLEINMMKVENEEYARRNMPEYVSAAAIGKKIRQKRV